MQDSGSDGVVILLLGNKVDCDEERQVSTEAGEQLAQVSIWALAPSAAWTGQILPLEGSEQVTLAWATNRVPLPFLSLPG